MRRTTSWWATGVVIAVVPCLLAGPAIAQHRMQPLRTDPHAVAAPDAGPAPAPPTATDAGAGDAGTPKFVETLDQKKRRQDYNAKTGPIIGTLVRANNKQVTQDERDLIKKHWARAHLLWRVRASAENEKDFAAVVRVDQLFAKMDSKLFEKLRKLNEKAPVKVADAGAK
jgi:hypothetical protein